MIRIDKDKVLEDYSIDVNGVITDKDGVIQEYKLYKGRYWFKRITVERIMMRTYYGYKNPYKWVIHHIDENKLNNSISNLVYLSRAEHARIHAQDRIWSEETKRKMSEVKKGKIFTKEHRKNLSLSHIGQTISEETKNIIRLSLIGNQHSKGHVWVNNGIINKCVFPDKIPDGFVRGMIK